MPTVVQAFGPYDISAISVPVIGFKGSQDDLLGGQEDEFFGGLSPNVSDVSTLLTFDGASGGALHNQVGSPYTLAAKMYAKLNPILQVRASHFSYSVKQQAADLTQSWRKLMRLSSTAYFCL